MPDKGNARRERLLVLALLFAMVSGTPLKAATPGETFTCHFGRYGKVTINTRSPGATITVNGHRHAAQDGSYFYQTKDGQIAVLFGPNMKWWTYNDIDDRHCARRSN